MKKMVITKIIKGLLYGLAIFVCALLIVNVCLDNSLAVLPNQYTRCAIGALIIGIGFSCSSLIYEADKISIIVRIFIHLIICVIVMVIGYHISGGSPNGTGFGLSLVSFLIEIGVGALIWLGNFIYFLSEAKLIQKKLKELEEVS